MTSNVIAHASRDSLPGVIPRQLFEGKEASAALNTAAAASLRDSRLKRSVEETMEIQQEEGFTLASTKRKKHINIEDMTAAAAAQSAKRAAKTTTAPANITTQNRFSPLSAPAENETSGNSTQAAASSNRPPPIQVYGITNVRAFAIDLGNALKTKDLIVQRLGPAAARIEDGIIRGDTCRLSLKTAENHRQAKEFLISQSIAYSTWAERKDKLTSFVITGLSSATTEDEIFQDLDALGIPVKKVRQLRMKKALKDVARFKKNLNVTAGVSDPPLKGKVITPCTAGSGGQIAMISPIKDRTDPKIIINACSNNTAINSMPDIDDTSSPDEILVEVLKENTTGSSCSISSQISSQIINSSQPKPSQSNSSQSPSSNDLFICDEILNKNFINTSSGKILSNKQPVNVLAPASSNDKESGIRPVELHDSIPSVDFLTVRYVCGLKIRIEKHRPPKGPPQCHRCQLFGHTDKACHMPPRCVKCGGNHLTADCKKEDGEAVVCANCKGGHPASYRGCPVYAKLKQRLNDLKNKAQSKI
ncbi:hypothetical protein J437_LFUL017439 [Ladona fulva]|uniref:Gag-like protein n=1 Tax=Ladona fulva TaxID=123851 RepID=A0A8K0KM55_LADFU|nr:hypothetical protein J437_LFUL017439 [Ladona fulva]